MLALGTFVIWTLYPLPWAALNQTGVSAPEVLTHRRAAGPRGRGQAPAAVQPGPTPELKIALPQRSLLWLGALLAPAAHAGITGTQNFLS